MKKHNLLAVLFVCLMTSCAGGQLNPSFVYEKNPQYTWGYAEFFGDYYFPENNNKNNVLSLSLFTDSLKINDLGNLTGLGQYLFLEDVFQAPTDTILQVGTYTINNSGSPFTVAPGKNDTIDNEVYPLGASISYYEFNASNSTLKLITGGSFIVSRLGSTFNISCNFITSDGIELKGNFSSVLPHFNQSISKSKSNSRGKLSYWRKNFN